MADSVRMIDLAGLTRGLEAFRHLDPEQRVLAHRLATQAAIRRVEEANKDVDGAEPSAKARVRRRDPEGERRGGREDSREATAHEEEAESASVLEREEGRLLDIKV